MMVNTKANEEGKIKVVMNEERKMNN